MRIENNLKRIFCFLASRYKEAYTPEFWLTVKRIFRERFAFFERIPHAEFLGNLKLMEKRPWNLHIELTNICNANCIFCAYRFQKRNRMIMSDEVYSKALSDYCALGGGELRLESCVGDPLVDLNFLERLRQARAHPEITLIGTLTNGINLDKIGIREMLQSGIDEIGISTGPWQENLYREIYGIPDYRRMRDNVVELVKKNLELKKPVRLKLLFRSSLPMRQTLNLPDYQAIRGLGHEVEFNTDFDTWLGAITQKELLDGMHLRPFCRLEKEPCYWLYDGPIVFVDGKVGLCGCRDFNADSELIIGDIAKDSLGDLWRLAAVQRLRQRFQEGKFPQICKKCSAYANLDFYRTKRGSARARLVNEWLSAKSQG